jgi:hypothetical protein
LITLLLLAGHLVVTQVLVVVVALVDLGLELDYQ